ncbi:methyltransferase domain-containing protein, partial [Candidatus Poribacteria bacterium]|nr:methyltransferase domain-containing protein [Candidatus Poribacteria bacterium]
MYKFANITPGIVFDLPFYGKVYVPGQFSEAFAENTKCHFFHSDDLENLSDLVNFLSKGGIAVLKGDWKSAAKLPERLRKYRDELIAPFIDEARQKGTIRNPRTRRWLNRRYQQTLSHIMLLAHNDIFPEIKPSPRIPHLLELLGDKLDAVNDLPILAPLPVVLKILSALENGHYISAFDMEIFSPPNVLAPFSQDTVDLFAEALQIAGDYIKTHELEILDMGCGSGVLTLLAANVLDDRNIHIFSTDILPEAVAATKINAQRFNQKSNTNVKIETTES